MRSLRLLLMLVIGLSAAFGAVEALDELRFSNGECLKGHFVAREGDVIVFDSVNLGRIRATESAATLRRADEPIPASTPVAETKVESAKPQAKETQAQTDETPGWRGGINLALELRRETSRKGNLYTKVYANKNAPKDEFRIDASYEHTVEGQKTTVDVMKSNGYWRHDLTPRYFSVYAPQYEWNRAFELSSMPLDYLLTRQQVGVGRTIMKRKRYVLRAGIAENYFHAWLSSPGRNGHAGAWVESMFGETDFRFPLGFRLVQRLVFYDDLRTNDLGWEHDMELTKKLTPNFNVGLHNELRQNVPGIQTSNYNLWRIYFGYEF